MHKIFFEIVNNSIIASFLIVAVIVLRMILKRAPKWSICLLWAMVAIRLVMPFEIESRFSLLPDINLLQVEQNQDTTIYPMESEQKGEVWEQYIQNRQNINQQAGQANKQNSKYFMENKMEDGYGVFSVSRIRVVSFIWLAGSLVLVTYAVLSFLRLKRKVSASIPLYDNVYLCDDIESPFVMGIFKPCIYLTSKIPREAWDSILKHEYAHIKRADHIWKLFGYALLVIYWFNPLSWVSYILFCKDMELACDEKATKDMDKNERADYCEALLTCNINRKKVDVCPVAFGEVGVKERIKQILNYKKPTFWMIFCAGIVCGIVAVCFMTNPESKKENEEMFDENMEGVSESFSNRQGETDIVTEYDHIQPDEQGYRWLTEERDVYVYEFEDLDKNGIEEYAKVYQIDTEQEYICRYIFYWNGEAIYEYENSYGMSPGEAEYLDLDRDGEKEIFLTFWPHVNSMPLQEYIVLKLKADLSWGALEMIQGDEVYQNAFPISITKGKNEWEAVISCKGLEKTESFDIAYYHSKLLELRETVSGEEWDYLTKLINDYKYGFPKESEWYTFGSVCAWGIWNIKSGEHQGKPCLIATHGIQGYDKFDFWGELDVYFDYDAQGKTRFLDIEFRNSETWAGTSQQVKVEFNMEDLIALCHAGSETLESTMTNFSPDGELLYSNFEKSISEYSLTWEYFCTLSYEGREYRMQVSYWKPEEAEEYGHKPNELDGIYLSYPATRDMQLLYASEERFTPDLDIRSFLEKEYDLALNAELDLPDNLKLGNYQMDLTLGEGCLFEGDYEEQTHGDGTPEDWYAPGGLEFIRKEYFPGEVRFEHGKLTEVSVLMNHSGIASDFEVIEGCDMQAVLCEYFCDLFTAAEAEEYMQEHGIAYEEFPWDSKYWYVFFAEEDSKYVYTLMLNQEYFEKEEIVKLARSVKFKVK